MGGNRHNGMQPTYLHCDQPIVYNDLFGKEVGTNCRFVLVCELLAHVLIHQRRLADTSNKRRPKIKWRDSLIVTQGCGTYNMSPRMITFRRTFFRDVDMAAAAKSLCGWVICGLGSTAVTLLRAFRQHKNGTIYTCCLWRWLEAAINELALNGSAPTVLPQQKTSLPLQQNRRLNAGKWVRSPFAYAVNVVVRSYDVSTG